MQLTLRHVGDPILTQPALPVGDPRNPAIQALIAAMIQMMVDSSGVGIAAPQVGIPLQIIIIASRPTLRYPHAPQMDPLPLINPQILAQDPDQEVDWEGCLSVPDQRGKVARPQSVWARAQDIKGQWQEYQWSGFVARIFYHEYDHLLGKVFLERDPQEVISEAEYQSLLISSTPSRS